MTTTENPTPVATAHVVPDFGLPYAPAGYDAPRRRCTSTCPACGHVTEGGTPKQAARAYGVHFTTEAKAGR